MCLNDPVNDIRAKAEAVTGRPMRSARDPIRHLDLRDEKALGKLASAIHAGKLPEAIAERDQQVARTLDATRARMPELDDDEPGQCVLCGECPCMCANDPDLDRSGM